MQLIIRVREVGNVGVNMGYLIWQFMINGIEFAEFEIDVHQLVGKAVFLSSKGRYRVIEVVNCFM